MRRRLRRFVAVLKMVQNPFHDRRIFDTDDHLDGAAALLTGFDIALEQASSSNADVAVLKYLYLETLECAASSSSSRFCEGPYEY